MNEFTDNPLIGHCLECQYCRKFYSISTRKWSIKCTCPHDQNALAGKSAFISLLKSDDQTPYLIDETTLNEHCPIYAERVILAANSGQ